MTLLDLPPIDPHLAGFFPEVATLGLELARFGPELVTPRPAFVTHGPELARFFEKADVDRSSCDLRSIPGSLPPTLASLPPDLRSLPFGMEGPPHDLGVVTPPPEVATPAPEVATPSPEATPPRPRGRYPFPRTCHHHPRAHHPRAIAHRARSSVHHPTTMCTPSIDLELVDLGVAGGGLVLVLGAMETAWPERQPHPATWSRSAERLRGSETVSPRLVAHRGAALSYVFEIPLLVRQLTGGRSSASSAQ